MKVGIITKIGKNYGAILQAFALKRVCEELGTESHIIKYTPKISDNSYRVCKFPWGRKGTLANIKALRHRREIQRGSRRFLDFRNQEFSFIGNYCCSEELENVVPDCDIFISGSDQVWNPQISFDEAFYLNFAYGKNKKLLSYAASIGLKCIPSQYYDEFCNRVKKFDIVTVREKQAQSILLDMGIKSTVTPDPTLLLDKKIWDEKAQDMILEPYILCYFVSFPREIKNTVNEVKEHLGIRVVNLMTYEESASVGDIKIRDAGPREFLGLFKNATYVITSSFHGTIFSIINRKPFITTLYQSTSSRVTELLENVNLSNRIFDPKKSDINDYYDEVIYNEDVEQRISELKILGRSILTNMLNNEKEK